MRKIAAFAIIALMSLALMTSCNSARHSCPAYSDVQPVQPVQTEQINAIP
jgi:hypothetical protein